MWLDFRLSPHLQRLLLAWLCTLASVGALAQTTPNAPQPNPPTLFEQARALEHGEGVARDAVAAADLYCQAARQGDRDAQYNLGWMYANGRGITRHDGRAAYLFQAAAGQGVDAAQRMLQALGGASAEMPDCMRQPEPEPEPPPLLAQVETFTRVDYSLVAPRQIMKLVSQLAPGFKVEPQLALAIIAAESNFNTQAVSVKNAQGLMQLIPETSARFNVKNAFDPAQNIRGGLTYLRWLLAYFEGDVALVAAAYNAGEGTVDRYRGVPPYQETRNYVARVLHSFGGKYHPFEAKITRPSALVKR